MFLHTSQQILLLPKLDSFGTDCHTSLPSMDNQSFFEEPSMGTRPLGSTLLLANGRTQILGIFTALYNSNMKGNFILTSSLENLNITLVFKGLGWANWLESSFNSAIIYNIYNDQLGV